MTQWEKSGESGFTNHQTGYVNLFFKIMEPFLTAAVAVATVVGTKAVEKTGEKLGETLFEKTNQFFTSLRQESPTTVTAIEKAPATPLNYSEIIPAIQAAAENRPELWAQIEELAELGRQEPRMIPHIQTAINNLSQSNPSIVNNSKLAEKIGALIQGGNNTINQNF